MMATERVILRAPAVGAVVQVASSVAKVVC
jgi:hypothetical protein